MNFSSWGASKYEKVAFVCIRFGNKPDDCYRNNCVCADDGV